MSLGIIYGLFRHELMHVASCYFYLTVGGPIAQFV
jgi:hypothetical protein